MAARATLGKGRDWVVVRAVQSVLANAASAKIECIPFWHFVESLLSRSWSPENRVDVMKGLVGPLDSSKLSVCYILT